MEKAELKFPHLVVSKERIRIRCYGFQMPGSCSLVWETSKGMHEDSPGSEIGIHLDRDRSNFRQHGGRRDTTRRKEGG